jgi:hypothetical protein
MAAKSFKKGDNVGLRHSHDTLFRLRAYRR